MTRATRAVPPAQLHPALTGTAVNALKIVVVGGYGVGKTTMVRSVSEIRPLHTEEVMGLAGTCRAGPGPGRDPGTGTSTGTGTGTGTGTEDTRRVRAKGSTTVAFDFGRITIDDRSILYLFGAPGQERFGFLWDRLFEGTLGAVVLVDTRSLPDAWYALDRLEDHGTPFIVAVNDFGGPLHSEEQIREALALGTEVPLVEFDARDHSSSKFVLLALVEHLHELSVREHELSLAKKD
ncbi:signal recognition particle receptor subunit beta [Streptomyces sp. SLBN-118]|uniref:GTP-binding protein n=1 Tax=Streptomyces sp. SLBN-118 TaxID=2768454 RepID=UPI001153E52B|nr:ATP/GTP-binding protein [Streptomyces sp. SLBN-118]TQK45330.1 signal recognition particle receptor subunit beta [Streptomyces sp. SLBN-118]